MIVLSEYLAENGFKLNSIKMIWHSVERDGGGIAEVGFIARVEAFDIAGRKPMSCMVEPAFFTADTKVRLEYECDDLILSEDSVICPGFAVLRWEYAKYGEMVVRSGEIRNEAGGGGSFDSRLSRLFRHPV